MKSLILFLFIFLNKTGCLQRLQPYHLASSKLINIKVPKLITPPNPSTVSSPSSSSYLPLKPRGHSRWWVKSAATNFSFLVLTIWSNHQSEISKNTKKQTYVCQSLCTRTLSEEKWLLKESILFGINHKSPWIQCRIQNQTYLTLRTFTLDTHLAVPVNKM